jgi:hypothetical protein
MLFIPISEVWGKPGSKEWMGHTKRDSADTK